MTQLKEISKQSVVKQRFGAVVSDMNGEKVMLSIENGKYYNLGKLGGEIWDFIQTDISVNELIVNLLEQYEVDASTCEKQVIMFLNMLAKENLIDIQ